MAYTPVTEVDSPALFYGQWSRIDEPKPRLAAYIDADDTTLTFTSPFLDREGNVVTEATIIGIKTAGGWIESCYVPAAGFSVDGMTATGVVRGVRPDGLDVTTGDTDFASEHQEGEIVFCNISAILQAITIGGLTGSLGANIKFNSRMLFMGSGVNAVPVFANAAARDAAIVSPANGDQAYLTDVGKFTDYTAGSWIERESGGTFPNATTAAAGKVELPTQSENNAGTAIGGTGASLTATPAIQAVTSQNQAWVYAVDSGAADAYVATLTPAVTAYTAGLSLELKIANANSGASTLNVNGLGVKNIYKNGALALEADDLQAGMIARFTYDGTQFQLVGAINNGTGYGADDAVYVTGTLGDAVSASDITNNLNLMYQLPSDMKWYKVTSSASTWYYRLGLAAQAGSANDSKKILLKGAYSNQTFANINPTFSSALSGTDVNVGDTTSDSARALLITNATGAEAVVTGGTITAKQQGTPAGSMLIYLVLENFEQANFPACFKDTTNNVVRGAIIGSATIAQALFSGTYQDLSFSFGGDIKIPAGARVFLVVAKTGAADAANYYKIRSDATTAALNSANQTWGTAANAGSYTLTVTSTSPVGYTVKAYNGTNGGYSLTPTTAWSRPIGQVLSSTQFFFDPEQKFNTVTYSGYRHIPTAASGFAQVTTNFCPTSLKVTSNVWIDAAADQYLNSKGYIKGDSATVSSFQFDTANYASSNGSAVFAGGTPTQSFSNVSFLRLTPTNATTGGIQNRLHAVRLENGYYLYSSYPSGANFIGAGVAGYVSSDYVFELEATL